ncbi:aminopeptidase [candidate division WOR-3 bacterium]|nr:aminopeptidase [candidate division WOR-3 bacterium]
MKEKHSDPDFPLAWTKMTDEEKKEAFEKSEEYRKFLSVAKTEREVVDWYKGKLTGKKYHFQEFMNKSISISRLGSESLESGINIIVSHIDSPRLDLKPNPLYEDSGLAFLKTHYYGGIKKYQWVSRPLALHCFLIDGNGEKKHIVIGENQKDPVFTINDLLPHLSHKVQDDKKIQDAIPGEKLNLLVSSLPDETKNEESVKKAVLSFLKDNYGVSFKDLLCAECEIVPSGEALDVGFDRSMIGGYGQDDRISAFCSFKAFEEATDPKKACMVLMLDKEEIGSSGDTGADSIILEDAVHELLKSSYKNVSYSTIRQTMRKSFCISADVACALNPDYPEVLEKNNAAKLGHGITVVKYAGSRGKSGTNDAHAETISKIRGIFDSSNVVWQIGELGKVDEGGGGTVAKFISYWGIPTIDCGTPVLSMHSPFEISHKADIFQTIKGFKAFYLS